MEDLSPDLTVESLIASADNKDQEKVSILCKNILKFYISLV